MDFQNSKLTDGEKSGESIKIDFNNIYPPMHALELEDFFKENWLYLRNKNRYRNVVKRTFYQYKK